MSKVWLKKGRAKPFWFRHPWVYSGAVRGVSEAPQDGEVVDLVDDEERFIGRGFYNSGSQIVVRVCTWDEGEAVDAEFFRNRVRAAYDLRRTYLDLPNAETNAFRLIHSEGDSVPGLVVDVFDRVLSVQFSSIGLKRWQEEILDALQAVVEVDSIVEHPSDFSMEKEGMHGEPRVVRGTPFEGPMIIRENGVELLVDLFHGQKTGYFLDQRDNRKLMRDFVSGKRVLDAYCYTGAFGLVSLLQGGAEEVVGVDSSARALELARENAARNDANRIRFEEHDVSDYLRQCAGADEAFDVVVLDPPKFARSKGDLAAAAGKYREVNRQALRVLRDRGLLVTCSCSQHLSFDHFVGVLNEAAKAEDRSLQIILRRSQAPDHPVRTSCPESDYLKCLVCVAG